ncbi:unnamed protein product, partial [Allacma fusca]
FGYGKIADEILSDRLHVIALRQT